MQKKIMRKAIDCAIAVFDLKDDGGEYSHCIWELWKRGGRMDLFPAHVLALLRLVVLVQMSSCVVERVFSHLSVICEKCKDNLVEDTTEIRSFLQCNGDLNDLMRDINKNP